MPILQRADIQQLQCAGIDRLKFPVILLMMFQYGVVGQDVRGRGTSVGMNRFDVIPFFLFMLRVHGAFCLVVYVEKRSACMSRRCTSQLPLNPRVH